MPSTSQLTSNSRSMNGLNTINANSVFTDSLEVGTLQIDTQGTAPTRTLGDNTTNIANCQFVQSAVNTAGANYVDLTNTQTISGQKTFSNTNTLISGNLITNSIRSASATTDINIGQNLTTGDINMGTTFIGPTMNIALNWGNGSNSGQLALRGGSFTLASTGNYNQSSGASFQTNISTNQSTGELAIGTAGARSGAIYINTGNTSTAPLNISSGTNTNAPITIGSTFSSTQTLDINAITTFSKIPSCSIAPTTGNDLCNKTYVDSMSGVSLSGSNVWTGTNSFNTNLPTSTLTPTTSTELTPKNYVDSNFVDKTTTQTITGDKTFTGQADFLSLSATYISNTSSIDTPSITSGLGTDNLNVGANQTSGILFLGCRTNRTGAINIGTLATGNAPINIGSTSSTTQTATHNAITTFNKIPLCSGVPATGDHLTNKTYVDGAISTAGAGYVNLTGTQTISGQKTFSNANTYIGGNLVSNNIKSTSGSLNISTNPASVVDNVNITTGAEMFLDCGSLGKIYLTQSGGSCMSINGGGAIFNVDVDFYGQTTIDPYTVFNMMPTATIIQNASSVVPSGFLYCDGTAVSRTTYSTLFNRLGTTYGAGNGTTTFNLPNFKGAFLRGASSQVVGGITYAGGAVGTAQQDSVLEPRNQGYWNIDAGGGGSSRQVRSRVEIATDPLDTGTSQTTDFARQNTTENRPFNHAVYYYIRY